MQLNVKTFLTISALALMPLSAAAQSSTDGEASDSSESDASADTGLSTGVPDNGGAGQTYVKATHGDWEMRCIRAKEGKDPCQLYQLLVDGNGNSVAEMNLFLVNGNDKLAGGATIVTPLETLLTANVRLAVDGGEGRFYPFSFCRTIGCFSRLGFTQIEIDQFKAGNAARVTIVPAAAPDQKVELSASLSGFTAGWKALQAEAE